ncbi:MAG TPA: hypothetical protein VEC16_04620 [Alphaproteobacteria bacterium]|nr:hypothetical protein [Alphaproteobacteria bacterium]
MFTNLFNKFKKEPKVDSEIILLSKIDKHMNFILRENLGSINKIIIEKSEIINSRREKLILALRELQRAKLMNLNIPEREIQIMDGNRENYVRKITHFTSSVDLPKGYLELYDYCVKFSSNIEQLNRDIQKNIFVLQHFFSNEIKNSNRALHDLEENIIEIRILLEKNGIVQLKEIQKDIKTFTENIYKINDLRKQLSTEKSEIASHQEKIDRLNDRIKIITSGTDYRALEGFRQEKGSAELEIKKIIEGLNANFSVLDTALRKYYYRNPEEKIIKAYLEDIKEAVLNDKDIDIVRVLVEVKKAIIMDQIDLKDKKKEHCIESIDKLTFEVLKDAQAKILKLEDQKQRAQAKITHNSASLNLSEQQYWINATTDKIKYHETNIEKLEKNINAITLENAQILSDIRVDLEKLMKKPVELKDDVSDELLKSSKNKESI